MIKINNNLYAHGFNHRLFFFIILVQCNQFIYYCTWIYLVWPMIYLLVLEHLSILCLLWSTLNFKTSNAELFTFENALCIGLR